MSNLDMIYKVGDIVKIEYYTGKRGYSIYIATIIGRITGFNIKEDYARINIYPMYNNLPSGRILIKGRDYPNIIYLDEITEKLTEEEAFMEML